MKSFSERMGLDTEKFQIQKDNISYPLRNALWNNIYLTYFQSSLETDRYPYYSGFKSIPDDIKFLSVKLWLEYFDRTIDEEFDMDIITHLVKEKFFKGQFNHVYDLVDLQQKSGQLVKLQ